jgi:ABC-type antimicrobial peptide transport system permease subunit
VLPDNLTPASIESRFKSFVTKYFNEEDGKHVELKLQPLHSVRFEERYHTDMGAGVNADYADLSVMAVLGVFILCIACINFINLATASAEKKSREIGIRKTLGAQRSQLAAYFLSETFLLTLISVGISLCATEWLLPHLNNLLEKRISLALFSNSTLILYLGALIIVTTFLAGYYPAVVLSKFNPTSILKNRFLIRKGSDTSVRRVLVVFQFLIAQVLLIGTLIIADQMNYARNKPLGFDKEAIVDVPIPNTKPELQESFRTRLEANPSIASVSFASGAPVSGRDISTDFFLTEATEQAGKFRTGFIPVDKHYLATYDIKLVSGRWFTEADEKLASIKLDEADQKFNYILNEAAVSRLGFQDPQQIIGKFVTTGFGGINAEVIGVVSDFHISSLHEEITPVVFTIVPSLYYGAGIKISSVKLRETMAFIESSWKETYPDDYFEYEFLDEHLASLYKNDEKTFTLFKIFAGVSIFIGCLGLYGLISFVANQKQKEVGIRKVMGASVSSILLLFTKDFVKLIVAAFLVAVPLSWYAMDQWLQGFAYRTEISWSIFAIGFLATVTIVLMTILYRSLRAANMNPAITLRSE